jgi:putative peptidoglycan lipid II flippase
MSRLKRLLASRPTLAAILSVGLIGAFVQLVMAVRDLIVAGQFGMTANLDAYLMALLLPALATQVIMNSFASALVPAFVHLRERHGPAEANRLVGGAIGQALNLIGALAFLPAIIGGPALSLMAGRLSPDKLDLAWRLYYALLPSVLFQGVSALFGVLIDAVGKFSVVALAGLSGPLLAVLLLLLFGAKIGVWALASGVVLGSVIEVGIILTMAGRLGLVRRPRWIDGHPALRHARNQAWPMMAGTALMNLSPIVDQSFATIVGSGAVSTLVYGNKLVGLIIALAATPLGTVLLPRFSQLVADGDLARLRTGLRNWSLIILALAIPGTALLAMASPWLVGVVFERGAFNSVNAEAVSAIQQAYLLQVPFYLLGIMGARMANALNLNHRLLAIAATGVGLNAALDYALLHWLGLPGIGFATSVVYFLSSAATLTVLFRHLRSNSNG